MLQGCQHHAFRTFTLSDAQGPTPPSRRAGVPLQPTASSLTKPEAASIMQVDTRVQFYKWFNELTDRGLIPRYPGYERGAKLPPPDQVTGSSGPAACVSAPECYVKPAVQPNLSICQVSTHCVGICFVSCKQHLHW